MIARADADRRRIGRRRPDQRREQRRLVWLEIGRGLAEVAARRGFDTVIPVAEVDRVEVLLQDLRLRVALFHLRREQDFANLAVVGAFRGKRRSRELLCDRAAALDDPPGPEVSPRRGGDANGIHSVMRIKASILDREQRVDHVRRNPVERHGDALLDEKSEGRFAQAVVHDRRLRPRREVSQ